MTLSSTIDLHCHSSASDGALIPAALIQRANTQGVTTLALTDHDTTAGLMEAQQSARSAQIKLIPGVEISTTWNNKCLHIIGLNIDPDYLPLQAGLKTLQTTRIERAEKIGLKLEKKRIPGAFDAVRQFAGNSMITRTHFAEFLLANHYVPTIQGAFDRYLSQGKPAYVTTQWADLQQAVGWITGSGGIAVLAHPLRYKLTGSWMKRLLTAFREMGGQGLEVVSGRNNPDEIRIAADYARRFDLSGSVGSDFHTPNNMWVELGRLAPLPPDIKPVWELLV